MPGGYLVLHLVDRDSFNPLVPLADPVMGKSVQTYAKKRITNSMVKFTDFEYKSNFEGDDPNITIFKEVLKDDGSGNIRQNEHKLYMDSQKEILNIAKDKGFIVLGKIDMMKVNYEYQYLYILQKPD